ncbi:conserved protein of unknown function [Ruminococcaceae bacterium BL-6]|nr:conserved protein of unknown function [Ruminococcaceae bacterium BL-6]
MEQGQGKKKTEKVRSPGAFRRIWGDFALWTRTFVVCVVDGRKDFPYVTRRLFQVPVDFCAAFTPYYGAQKAGRFAALLTDYLFGMARFLEKLKCGGPVPGDMRRAWYRSAGALAEFLSELNPLWNRQAWQNSFYRHLTLTEKQAQARLRGKHEEEIAACNGLSALTGEMADRMTRGIALQFEKKNPK